MFGKQALRILSLMELAYDEPNGILFSSIDDEFGSKTLTCSARAVLPLYDRPLLLNKLFARGMIKVKFKWDDKYWMHQKKCQVKLDTLLRSKENKCRNELLPTCIFALTKIGGAVFSRLTNVHWTRVFTTAKGESSENGEMGASISAENIYRLIEVESAIAHIDSFQYRWLPNGAIHNLDNWKPYYWCQPMAGVMRNYRLEQMSPMSLQEAQVRVGLRQKAIQALWWREHGFFFEECLNVKATWDRMGVVARPIEGI